MSYNTDQIPSFPKLTDRIRDAVRQSGATQADVSRHSGVAPSALSRFMGGTGGLSLDSLDRLAYSLGVVVVPEPEWRRMENVWRAYQTGRLQAAPVDGAALGRAAPRRMV